MAKKLIAPRHLGDGVYVHDEGHQLNLAVNHHENKVICIEKAGFLGLIDYALQSELITQDDLDGRAP